MTAGLKIYGKNWKKVEGFIGTRTGTQIRSHAQKFFNRIKKDLDDGQENPCPEAALPLTDLQSLIDGPNLDHEVVEGPF